jgi:membrane-associated phospholipid phosphatase
MENFEADLQQIPAQVETISFPTRLKQRLTAFNCTMGVFAVVLLTTELILARMVHLTNIMLSLFGMAPAVIMLTICLVYCIERPMPRLIEASELTIWATVLFTLEPILMVLAGRSPRPMMDSTMAAIDGHLRFSTAAIANVVSQSSLLQLLSNATYMSLYLLILGVVILPSIFGYCAVSRRFVMAVIFAAVITATMFAVLPASGPWTVEHFYVTTAAAADTTNYLLQLKTAGPVALNLSRYAIVSFPSFHCVLAITAGTVVGSFRKLRVWGWLWASLICVSTITTGWHYGIDVIGGVLVAIISIGVARIADKYMSPSNPFITITSED